MKSKQQPRTSADMSKDSPDERPAEDRDYQQTAVTPGNPFIAPMSRPNGPGNRLNLKTSVAQRVANRKLSQPAGHV